MFYLVPILNNVCFVNTNPRCVSADRVIVAGGLAHVRETVEEGPDQEIVTDDPRVAIGIVEVGRGTEVDEAEAGARSGTPVLAGTATPW